MEPSMMPLIILAVFGGIIAWSFHYEKLRRKRFAELCQTHGFTNHEQPSENLFRMLSQHGSSESAFPFFSRGRTQRILLLAEKKTVDRTNAIGLLRYRSGGKNKNTRHLSFCIFIRPGANLPHFQICPESVLHKFIQNFGYQDIDLPNYPEFSKKFLLRGTQPERIVQLFSPTLIQSVENFPGICIEAQGAVILCYKERQSQVDDSFMHFHTQAAQLAGQIFSTAR